MYKTIPVTLLLLSLCLANLLAQDKLWEADLSSEVKFVSWIDQTNNGYIIASGTKGLMALDHSSGETIWVNEDLGNLAKDGFRNIEGLPLFIAESGVANRARAVIVNAADGQVLFDTREGDFRIKDYHILLDEGFILFELSSPGDRSIMKFNLRTWQSEWSASVGKAKGLIAKSRNLAGQGFILHGPIIGPNGELIIGLQERVHVYDGTSGKELWQLDAKKWIKALVYSPLNNSLYLGIKGSKKLTVLDPSNGDDITPGKLKLKGTLIDVGVDGRDNLILVETEGFNLIKPQTGELIWKKSFKIDYLDEVITFDDGYIAIGKDEKKGSIAVVDNDGKKVWNSGVKGYVYYATPAEKGILYISTERANILGYNDGKDLWKRDVKFRSIPAVTYDTKEDKVVLFENKKGYKFDLNSGDIELFAEDVEMLDVNKKTPLVAEYVSTGYFISDDQHTSLLDPQGKLAYSKYFVPVTTVGGLAGLADFGLRAAGVDLDIDIAGSLANLEALHALSQGTYGRDHGDTRSETKVAAGLYVGGAGNMSPVFEVTATRHYNSKESRDHKFIVAQREDGDTSPEKNFIYMLNKSTGEVEKKIKLDDKIPDYVVDEIDQRVFINSKNQVVTGYQM